MKVVVKKLIKEESIIQVETRAGAQKLTIKKTEFGHSYEDFSEWDITDDQYYRLEEFTDEIMKKMDGKDNLEVVYDL